MGYSYAWLANVKARAKDGAGAAEGLTTFARAFCLPNSFHVYGNQTKSGLSRFTYRPFMLEGNFAFAAGLQEMLLQSYAGFIEIMPAIPAAWEDVSFESLRAEGAFLVSAKRSDRQLSEVTVSSEKGGVARLKLPRKDWKIQSANQGKLSSSAPGFTEINLKPGGSVTLTAR